MRFFLKNTCYILSEIITSTPVLWSVGSLLATAITGELFGILLNIGILSACIWLVVYEAATGNKRNLPFGVLVLSGLGTIASVLYQTISNVGFNGLWHPNQLTVDALTYSAARLAWVFASSVVVITTRFPKLAHKRIFNHLFYYNIGSIFAVQGAFLATVFFITSSVQAMLKTTFKNPFISKCCHALSAPRLAFFGYVIGSLLLASKNPFLAISTIFWGLGFLGFERDRNLALLGLRMPMKPVV